MKRTLLYLVALLISFSANSQFEVRDYNTDELITDGQSLSFTEAGCGYSDPCNWKFKVTNTSASTINMRIVVDNMENTDGSDFQLCFAGVCLNSVSLGSAYPSTAATIAPGATNSAGNNMWNLNPPGTTTDMSWTFRFQAYDALGIPTGTPVTMTYRYEPNLSIEDNELANVNIFPTVAKNEINISSLESLNATFYDLNGRKAKEIALNSGENQINVSDLSSQLYILSLTNSDGKQFIQKIVIK